MGGASSAANARVDAAATNASSNVNGIARTTKHLKTPLIDSATYLIACEFLGYSGSSPRSNSTPTRNSCEDRARRDHAPTPS
jgi:hypothetical protein